ncbi:acetyltransferase [Grimontia sp. AD028]|uniref:GNAT family N-acetyltransferase n=1 Tax=Grimontia sp. AD028 TaxID=1581149 RepID=UPI00061B3876|nr:GNAT family N-acetyltransferase [Grimontia sp. AD028]KKD59048.1 acetyltransferase [Grimontia sp. AD028]
MTVSLKPIDIRERHVLENLFSYYVYEFSKPLGLSLDSDGKYAFKSETLNPYWLRDDHHPYFILSDGELAGFVLVRRYPPNIAVWDIDQFFVLRKFTGKGIGRKALLAALDKRHGDWQIRILKENIAVLGFWQSAVEALVEGDYSLGLEVDTDLEMYFIHFHYPSTSKISE